MLEMAAVLISSAVLMIIAYEFTHTKRKWGENSKSFF